METNKTDKHDPKTCNYEVFHPDHYDIIRERDLLIDKNASGEDILAEGYSGRK